MLDQSLALSQSDANLILEIIHESLECRESAAFVRLIDKAKALVGFSYARCGFGDSNEYESKKMGAFRMVTGFPEAWEIRYNEKDYYLNDNIAYAAFHKRGLIYWSDYISIKGLSDTRNEESKKIMQEAASLGLSDGWLFSSSGRRGSEFAFLSLAGEKIENTQRNQRILAYLSPHLTRALKKIVLGQMEKPPKLTAREAEVLSWTAVGKTAWEVSKILNISRRTVEFHIGNVLKKLDAVNSHQAVATALYFGMIEY